MTNNYIKKKENYKEPLEAYDDFYFASTKKIHKPKRYNYNINRIKSCNVELN